MLYQQGDLLLETVDSIPELPRRWPTPDGHHILSLDPLAHGAHVVHGHITVYTFCDRQLFVSADVEFTVRHPSHRPITVRPGLYSVRCVREFAHFGPDPREVRPSCD